MLKLHRDSGLPHQSSKIAMWGQELAIQTPRYPLKNMLFCEMTYYFLVIFINCIALAKQGDYRIGSVRLSFRPSVRLFVCALTVEPFDKSHYHFKVLVCVSVISGRLWIIARMRSIGVLILSNSRPY